MLSSYLFGHELRLIQRYIRAIDVFHLFIILYLSFCYITNCLSVCFQVQWCSISYSSSYLDIYRWVSYVGRFNIACPHSFLVLMMAIHVHEFLAITVEIMPVYISINPQCSIVAIASSFIWILVFTRMIILRHIYMNATTPLLWLCFLYTYGFLYSLGWSYSYIFMLTLLFHLIMFFFT